MVSHITPGDIVRVRPGDNIPVDGDVVKGLSSVNEATITGESLPVDKVPGMQVFAGTNNLTGALDITVTKAGKDTTLGKVQSLIMQAEHTKIPIMRIIDRYVKWYTPTILMIAGIVLVFHRPDQFRNYNSCHILPVCPDSGNAYGNGSRNIGLGPARRSC